MANHVIYDRIWESKKLSRCTRDAALAYPSIFLVADDHGRFEFNPRRIWSKVFGNRADVPLEDVVSWLDEYWRQGLLVRYHADGDDLAYWSKFRGRKMSERRGSELEDPDGLPILTPPAYLPPPGRGDSAPVARTYRDDSAVAPRSLGEESTPEIDQDRDQDLETEQIRSGSEPSNQPAREEPGVSPPEAPLPDELLPHDVDPRPWVGRPEPLVDGRRGELELEWLRLVGEIAVGEGKNPEEIAPPYQGRRGLNPADLSPKRLLRDVMDLRVRRAALDPTAPPPPVVTEKPPSETADYDRRHDLAAEFLAWYRLNPEAGEFGGRAGMHGVAFGKWAKSKGLAEWVRASVLPIVTSLLARPSEAPAPPADPGQEHQFSGDSMVRSKSDRAPLCAWCEKRREDPVHVEAIT